MDLKNGGRKVVGVVSNRGYKIGEIVTMEKRLFQEKKLGQRLRGLTAKADAQHLKHGSRKQAGLRDGTCCDHRPTVKRPLFTAGSCGWSKGIT
eukprot:746474-Hanusia_phi.AAC.4